MAASLLKGAGALSAPCRVRGAHQRAQRAWTPDPLRSVRRAAQDQGGDLFSGDQPRAPTPEELAALSGAVPEVEAQAAAEPSPQEPTPEVTGPRDDDVLPDSLEDSLSQAAQACCDAMERGQGRMVVEILVPDFWDPISGAMFRDEGDQQRFWRLTRRFIDQVRATAGDRGQMRAIYPDMGVAAMLKNSWAADGEEIGFEISALTDRNPVSPEDGIVVVAAPDPQGLEETQAAANSLGPGQAMILFNPRLASGDVGIGLNVRRMRDNFLGSFVTAYSIRPIEDVGSVFRRYPGLWQVFVEDETTPGRYKLVAEEPRRPAGEALDSIVMRGLGLEPEEGEEQEGGGLMGGLGNALRAVASLQKFARSLTK
ncbi:unnamed protein product [Pedinophyceae sp. YPF-701]|nr:unnamed protein product [Pedinophyceae sp. YPF-701]